MNTAVFEEDEWMDDFRAIEIEFLKVISLGHIGYI